MFSFEISRQVINNGCLLALKDEPFGDMSSCQNSKYGCRFVHVNEELIYLRRSSMHVHDITLADCGNALFCGLNSFEQINQIPVIVSQRLVSFVTLE